MKTIFAISDLHGHYYETLDALKEAGWDENNPDHLLIVCGDLFDRGDDSLAIFEWLYKLSMENKAVVLKGNHESFFIEFLEGSTDSFNFIHNGLNTTIDDFDHRTSSFQSWCLLDEDCDISDEAYAKWASITSKNINDEYSHLLPWLKSLPYYYETEHYIFTHASIDTLVPDWHYPHCEYHGKYLDWEACAWDDGSFFGKSICNTNKTVVVGHYGTTYLRKMYNIQDLQIYIPRSKQDATKFENLPNQYSILIRNDKRVVAIDGTTILSKQVNVLKIENETLIPTENKEQTI